MKDTKITCDSCGNDLTYTGNCIDYRILVCCEVKPLYPGSMSATAMGISPPLEGDHHFCGSICLRKWKRISP